MWLSTLEQQPLRLTLQTCLASHFFKLPRYANVIVMPSCPGKIYTTAVGLVFAYLNVANGDLGGLFADFTDETGVIAVSRGRHLNNLTFESVFFGANVLC